jgi:hypothetical protein
MQALDACDAVLRVAPVTGGIAGSPGPNPPPGGTAV